MIFYLGKNVQQRENFIKGGNAQNILHWILSVNAICLAEGNREKLRSYPLFSKQENK